MKKYVHVSMTSCSLNPLDVARHCIQKGMELQKRDCPFNDVKGPFKNDEGNEAIFVLDCGKPGPDMWDELSDEEKKEQPRPRNPKK